MPTLEIIEKFEAKTLEELKRRGFPSDPNRLIGKNVFVKIINSDLGGFLSTITGLSRARLGFLIHVSQYSVMGAGRVEFVVYIPTTGWQLATIERKNNKRNWHECIISPNWPSLKTPDLVHC